MVFFGKCEIIHQPFFCMAASCLQIPLSKNKHFHTPIVSVQPWTLWAPTLECILSDTLCDQGLKNEWMESSWLRSDGFIDNQFVHLIFSCCLWNNKNLANACVQVSDSSMNWRGNEFLNIIQLFNYYQGQCLILSLTVNYSLLKSYNRV